MHGGERAEGLHSARGHGFGGLVRGQETGRARAAARAGSGSRGTLRQMAESKWPLTALTALHPGTAPSGLQGARTAPRPRGGSDGEDNNPELALSDTVGLRNPP